MNGPDPHALPSRWPVFVAIALVTTLVLGMLGVDLVFARRVADQTDDIIGNSQRSIVLLQDLRTSVTRLLGPDLRDREMETLIEAVSRDVRDYVSLAAYEGEREEWTVLQGLLQGLLGSLPGTPPTRAAQGTEIYRSINRLTSINLEGARRNAVSIRAAHHQAFVTDALAGTATLALVVAVCIWLLRVLGQQRLLIAQQLRSLADRNADLEAFAGRAAHDLRSPMSPIRGYADLIAESKGLPQDLAEMAQRIRRAVDRMTRVVDDMLALSTAGRPPPGQASTAAVVAAVTEELAPELGEVELVTALAAGRVACADSVLMQILRNLLGNALKFRSRTRPLRIAIETRDVSPLAVEIAIEDNGVGMDAESARHSFEPFYRGSTALEVPGHGLGLAIVERTVRALGGTCQLSSVLDRGTRIVVRLPRPTT